MIKFTFDPKCLRRPVAHCPSSHWKTVLWKKEKQGGYFFLRYGKLKSLSLWDVLQLLGCGQSMSSWNTSINSANSKQMMWKLHQAVTAVLIVLMCFRRKHLSLVTFWLWGCKMLAQSPLNRTEVYRDMMQSNVAWLWECGVSHCFDMETQSVYLVSHHRVWVLVGQNPQTGLRLVCQQDLKMKMIKNGLNTNDPK